MCIRDSPRPSRARRLQTHLHVPRARRRLRRRNLLDSLVARRQSPSSRSHRSRRRRRPVALSRPVPLPPSSRVVRLAPDRARALVPRPSFARARGSRASARASIARARRRRRASSPCSIAGAGASSSSLDIAARAGLRRRATTPGDARGCPTDRFLCRFDTVYPVSRVLTNLGRPRDRRGRGSFSVSIFRFFGFSVFRFFGFSRVASRRSRAGATRRRADARSDGGATVAVIEDGSRRRAGSDDRVGEPRVGERNETKRIIRCVDLDLVNPLVLSDDEDDDQGVHRGE